MKLNHADVAIDYLYTKYLSHKSPRYLPKPPKQIVEEPFLRNFYAGIKPSSFKYLYPDLYINDKNDVYEYTYSPRKNLYKGYRRPIKYNKRLCPWNERKLHKFRINREALNTTNKFKKNDLVIPDPFIHYDGYIDNSFLQHMNKAKKDNLNELFENSRNDSFPYSYKTESEYSSQDNRRFKLDYYHISLAKYFFSWLTKYYKRIEIAKQHEEKSMKKNLKDVSTMTNRYHIDEEVGTVALKPILLNHIIIDEDSFSSQDEYKVASNDYDEYNDQYEPYDMEYDHET